jgi:AAA lid domain
MLCRPGRTGRPAGDVVRGIDTLGNARFVRTVLERAQEHRSAWLVSEFGLAEIDLSDESAGAEIGTEALEVLTEADLAEGLAAALPRRLPAVVPATRRGSRG